MIKLNPHNRAVRFYQPPIAVKTYFGDVDVHLDTQTQLDQLLWIPAVNVSRFIGQFPYLESEGDELFSIGTAKVWETILEAGFPGNRIGAVCNIRCRRAMEDYCNNLSSAISISTSTRYKNRRQGVRTPSSQNIEGSDITQDDDSAILINDACEVLGFDSSNLSLRQKRKLHKVLS